jgi:hypothetical protein
MDATLELHVQGRDGTRLVYDDAEAQGLCVRLVNADMARVRALAVPGSVHERFWHAVAADCETLHRRYGTFDRVDVFMAPRGT